MKKTACLLFICLSVMSFADGGGGFFFGMQASQYPLLENYPVNNNSMGLSYFGGYGYGITRHVIAGGFGYAFLDLNDTSGIAGGLGRDNQRRPHLEMANQSIDCQLDRCWGNQHR